MDKITLRVADALAGRSTRRGFLGGVTRAMLLCAGVAGGIAMGEGLGLGTALADCSGFDCCTGTECGACGCPTGTTSDYTWSCCYGGRFHTCTDCYYANGGYACTFEVNTLQGC